MGRVRQIAFLLALLAWCWFGMMAVHELGHVVGAWTSGGTVKEVVLHPLKISETRVRPNPQPGYVVWMGPTLGCLLPLMLAFAVPRGWDELKPIAQYFAGFCLIANGAYLAGGAAEGIGDCGVMLRTGTPIGLIIAAGAVGIVAGMTLWHRLGSPVAFLSDPNSVSPRTANAVVGALAVVIALWLAALYSIPPR